MMEAEIFARLSCTIKDFTNMPPEFTIDVSMLEL